MSKGKEKKDWAQKHLTPYLQVGEHITDETKSQIKAKIDRVNKEKGWKINIHSVKTFLRGAPENIKQALAKF